MGIEIKREAKFPKTGKKFGPKKRLQTANKSGVPNFKGFLTPPWEQFRTQV